MRKGSIGCFVLSIFLFWCFRRFCDFGSTQESGGSELPAECSWGLAARVANVAAHWWNERLWRLWSDERRTARKTQVLEPKANLIKHSVPSIQISARALGHGEDWLRVLALQGISRFILQRAWELFFFPKSARQWRCLPLKGTRSLKLHSRN